MTKTEFIKKLKNKVKSVEFIGKKGTENYRFVFANMTSKNREWFKLEMFSDEDDTGKLKTMQKMMSEQSYSIYDIIDTFERHS